MQNARDHLVLLAQGVFLVCIVIILATLKPVQQQYSTIPVSGPKGEDAVVDYEQIEGFVQQEVLGIPKPKNGQDGKDGRDGKDADLVDYAAIEKVIQQKIQEAFDAREKPQEPTPDSEYRQNPKNGKNEWRLAGDDSWQLCSPEDSCL
jgi:hypothetical protein